MFKEDYIAKYGEEAYERKLERSRVWHKAHREKVKKQIREWERKTPEKVKAGNRRTNREKNRKNGKFYEKILEYKRTGIQGEKNKIRHRHKHGYAPFKRIIAPDSRIHHEWIPTTAHYRGVALVEAKPHRYGIIDVIEILDGEITLLTEEEDKRGFGEKEEKDKMEEEKNKKKGRYLQLPYYVSDANEALVLQAGIEIGRFLDICVEDAVKRGKENLGVE